MDSIFRILGLDPACAGMGFYETWATKIFVMPTALIAVCIAYALYETQIAARSKQAAVTHLRANIYFVVFLVRWPQPIVH